MIKAVIFDLDGVLIDSEKLHYITWKKAFMEKGAELPLEEYREHYFGITATDIVKQFAERRNMPLSSEELKELAYRKNVHYRELVAKELEPVKGAPELLEKLKKANFMIALATSTTRKNLQAVMKKTGLGRYMDSMVCAQDITKGKPDPEIFLKAASNIREKPENCLVIEDAPLGINAAKRAGMKCIAVATTHKTPELANADMVVKDLSQLTVEKIRGLGK